MPNTQSKLDVKLQSYSYPKIKILTIIEPMEALSILIF